MKLRALALLLALPTWVGCSLILDPANCSSDSDCLAGGVCKSGICVGGTESTGGTGGTGGVEADSGNTGGLIADARLPDARPTDGPAVDAAHDAAHDAAVDAAMDMGPPPDAAPTVQPPVCSFISPDDNNEGLVIAAPTFSLTVQVTDGDTPPDQLVVTLNNQPITLDPASHTSTTDVNLVEGSNTFLLQAHDPEGHPCSAHRTIVRDSTGPTIELFDPAGNPLGNQLQTADSPLIVVVHATDAHTIQTVTATQNGNPNRDVVGPDGDTGDYLVTFLPSAGDNDMVVTATDAPGNMASTHLAVYFDGTAPQLQVASPVDGQLVEVNAIDVRGSVQDNLDVANISIAVQVVSAGHPPQNPLPRRPDDALGNFRFAGVPLFAGNNTITVTASDAIQSASQVVHVNVQAGAPDVDIVSPVDNHAVGTADVEVTGTASPSVNEVHVGLPGNRDTVVPANGAWRSVVHLPNEGAFNIEAQGSTQGGRQSLVKTVRIVYDSSAPQVRITTPVANFCTRGDTIHVDGDVVDLETDVAVMQLSVGNASVPVPVRDRTRFFGDVAVGPGLGQILTASGDNAAGIRGQAQTTVNVDRTPPIVTLDLANNAWAAADPDGILIVHGTVVDEGCGLAAIPLIVNGADALASPEGAFASRQHVQGDTPHITAVATDVVGNQGRAEIDVRIDRNPPSVDQVDPSEDIATRNANVSVSAVVADGESGLASVTIDGVAVAQPVNGRYMRTVGLVPGPNRIAIVATDHTGLETSHLININRDTQAPTVAVTWPTAGANVGDKVTVTGTADDGLLGSGVDRITVNNVDVPVAADGTWIRADVQLIGGLQSLTIVGWDRAGNASAPLSVSVTVKDFNVTPAEKLGLDGAADIGWIGPADLDGDGRLDLVALRNTAVGTSRIFIQKVDGTFTGHPLADFGLPNDLVANDAAFGDFNADERIDLVVAADAGASMLYYGDRQAGFTAAVDPIYQVGGDVSGVAVGDINRDGNLDILFVSDAATSVLFTQFGGSAQRADLASLGGPDMTGMTRAMLVDLNTDGLQDLVAVGPAGSRAWLGSDAGTFGALPGGVNFGDQPAAALIPLDADKDRDLDVVVAGDNAVHTNVLGGNVITGMTLGNQGLTTSAGDQDLAGGDLDGDTREDVAVFGQAGLTLFGGGAVGFSARNQATLGIPALGALNTGRIVDLDGDADLDLVVAGPTGIELVHSNVTTTKSATYAFVRVQATRSFTGLGPKDAVGVLTYVDYLTAPAGGRVLVNPVSGPLVVTYPLGGRANIVVQWIDKVGGVDNYTSQVGNNRGAQAANAVPIQALPQE